jgi:uncharacterized protein YndB with AHSA1/START domain
MTTRSVLHDTFCLERRYEASPARVFQAFADPAAKRQWFTGPSDWTQHESSFDFREGGGEVSVSGPDGGPLISFRTTYLDIVADERIVYTYEMAMDGKRISVSVATIELRPEAGGTRLIVTEQGAYLDGLDAPKFRIEGTEGLLDALGTFLAGDDTGQGGTGL